MHYRIHADDYRNYATTDFAAVIRLVQNSIAESSHITVIHRLMLAFMFVVT